MTASNRRDFLTTASLAGLAAATPLMAPRITQAAAPMLGASQATYRRVKLGGFEITTIYDGERSVGQTYPFFGANASEEEVQALAQANLLPADRMSLGFTPTLVNTGDEVILFDAGNGTGRGPDTGKLVERLATAGITPDQVDVVVLTHFHFDHIGGLMADGEAVFPNARYVAAASEYDFWTNPDLANSDALGNGHQMVMSNVVPMVEKTTFISNGEDVVSGVTAIAAYGHTPGHTAYHIESEGQRLVITADAANHFVLSLQRPDWHFTFDMDGEAAAKARKDLFGMIAADQVPFIGYHMPFPSIGYVQAQGRGFHYSPLTYQLDQ